MRVRAAILVVGLAVGVFGARTEARAATPSESEVAASEKALAGKILAPCCWNQTIDIHGSEPSNELRKEIRQRLRAGETADAIEADIVARYGERILAVPKGSPLSTVAAIMLALVGLAGIAVVFIGARLRGKPSETASTETTASLPAERASDLDDRIDAALREDNF